MSDGMSGLRLKDLTVCLGGRRVVDGVSLTVAPGECVGLIGPNGAGKSSLMRAALGLIPFSGHSNIAAMPPRERALAAAWLPQTREIAWNLSVETLVALGRTPHRRLGADLSAADRRAIEGAMAAAGVAAFRDRPATALSGGEQARVLLARALAQEAPLILADEPIAALDPAHQLATMELFASAARDGSAIVTALHDLSLAATWCSRLILMNAGKIVADGAPEAVLTPERLCSVYGVRFFKTEAQGTTIVQALARVPGVVNPGGPESAQPESAQPESAGDA